MTLKKNLKEKLFSSKPSRQIILWCIVVVSAALLVFCVTNSLSLKNFHKETLCKNAISTANTIKIMAPALYGDDSFYNLHLGFKDNEKYQSFCKFFKDIADNYNLTKIYTISVIYDDYYYVLDSGYSNMAENGKEYNGFLKNVDLKALDTKTSSAIKNLCTDGNQPITFNFTKDNSKYLFTAIPVFENSNDIRGCIIIEQSLELPTAIAATVFVYEILTFLFLAVAIVSIIWLFIIYLIVYKKRKEKASEIIEIVEATEIPPTTSDVSIVSQTEDNSQT